MPSEAAKKRKEKKKGQGRGKPAGKSATNEVNGAVNGSVDGAVTNGTSLEEKLPALKLSNMSVTGVLLSHPESRDLHLGQITLRYHGAELLVDAKVELNNGRRYGLLGVNGSGKSTFMQALSTRELPIPEHFDIFHLTNEIEPSTKTALECVMEVNEEKARLEREADILAHRTEDEMAHERLMDIYERLDELDSAKAETTASRLLHGLGFTPIMQATQTKDFSGGWRMRVALARALFVKPYLLLLDEPTNHLDLNACVWLEQELKTFKNILVLVSHSQDFLNGVCSNIILMQQGKLSQYTGNYDTFCQTKDEQDENQMKLYKKEQADLAKMKEYVARFGHGSRKLAKQGKSKEKLMNKRIAEGMTEKVFREKTVTFKFTNIQKLPPPILSCQSLFFRYTETTPWIYENLEFGMDLDTRVALVGPNGAGKSTLLKLIAGELIPTDGMIKRHSHLKIARYHQHLAEKLDMDLSPLQYMMKEYPEVKEIEDMRKIVGRYGITGKDQVVPIRNLSDGLRCRVALAWLARQNGHMLLLDEPTNHLDIETIDALADAINNFNGGLVLVSHDFRLISQVAEEIWECDNGTVTKWPGDIISYKQNLISTLDDKIVMGKSADNRTQRAEPVQQKAPPPKPVGIKLNYTPSFQTKPTKPTSNGNSVATTNGSGGGYLPPHKRNEIQQSTAPSKSRTGASDDWFNDE